MHNVAAADILRVFRSVHIKISSSKVVKKKLKLKMTLNCAGSFLKYVIFCFNLACAVSLIKILIFFLSHARGDNLRKLIANHVQTHKKIAV